MGPEIERGIAELKAGGWDNEVQGILEFALVALQIPQALNTCENMGDDIAAIEAWAQIFTDPAQLAATITKHYAFHKKEIDADISAVTTDWDASLMFQTGDDIAKLLTDAVGPISPVGESNEHIYDPNMIPELVAGWIYERNAMSAAPFADVDALSDYMLSCFSPDPSLADKMQAAINVIAEGLDVDDEDKIKQGAQQIFALIPLFE